MVLMRTLVITSTVYVNSNLTILVNVEERIKQYLQSICFYLSCNSVDQIIICDNSNFDYSRFSTFFQAISDKKIEYLFFEGDKAKILEKGKGYGEGEIMKYILDRSKILLPEMRSFIKVTGRLKVLNIDDILAKASPEIDYFQRAGSNPFNYLKAIDTRFYQCTFNTFKNYLIDEYQKVNDNNGFFLEHCYYRCFLVTHLAIRGFDILPVLSGISGSTGLFYDESWSKKIVKKLLYRIAKFTRLS